MNRNIPTQPDHCKCDDGPPEYDGPPLPTLLITPAPPPAKPNVYPVQYKYTLNGANPNGPIGPMGTPGSTGITGTIGWTGTTGTTGTTGPAGTTGWTGRTGWTGWTGTTGFTGFTGATGFTGGGVTGSTGFTGSTGAAGSSMTLVSSLPVSPLPNQYVFNTTTKQISDYDTITFPSVTGLQAWYDAADPLANGYLPATGATVGTWFDKSGNGKNTVGAGGATITQGNDGLPFLNFTNSYYTIPSTLWTSGNGFTIFMVEAPNSTSAYNYFGNTAGYLGGNLTFYAGNNTTQYFGSSTTIAVQPAGFLVLGVTNLWSFTFDNSITTYKAFWNGVQQKSSLVAAAPTNFMNLIGGIGGAYINGSYNGKMREFMIYQGNMTDADRQKIESYLAWKWNTQATLPVNHPYKTIPYSYNQWVSPITMVTPTITTGTTNPSSLAPNGSVHINTASGQLFKCSGETIPTTVAGLQLWLDSADSSNFTFSSGTNVAAWKDKSGNGYNAVPTLNGGTITYTGLPGVNFAPPNTTTATFLTSPIPANTFNNALYIFAVYKNTSSTQYNGLITRTNPGAYVGPFNNYGTTRVFNNSISSSSYNSYNPSISLYNVGINYAGNTAGEWSNGSANTLTRSGTLTATGADSAATQLYIGTQGDSITSFAGVFYEILVYNVALSTSERQQVEGYLASKWNLQSNLPIVHPYSSSTPLVWNSIVNMTGNTLTTGTSGTGPVTAKTNDYFINTASGLVYQNIDVFVPVTSLGNIITSGPSAPLSSATAPLGSYYLNTSTGQIFQYTGAPPGAQLWLDGADPLGTGIPPTNGSTLATWIDKSGNGYNGTATGTPTYTPSGITFNGAQRYSTNYTSFAAAESIFVVYTLTTNTQSALLATNSSGGRDFQSYTASQGPSIAKSGISWAIYGAYPVTTGQAYIAEGFYDSSGTSVLVTGNASASNTTNPAFTAGTSWIGATYNGYNINGMISEVIVYNSVISTSQRQIVEGYLAWKWGIQANLPVGHPYFSAAPRNFSPITPWPTVLGGSRIAGTTYATPLTLTIGLAEGGTAMYQVGPITTTASSKLLITASLSIIPSASTTVQMTVGRSTTNGSPYTPAVNVASGTNGIPLPISSSSPAYFMAAQTVVSGQAVTLSGTAVDFPAAVGTYYYTIWASAGSSMTMASGNISANLSVVHM